MANNKWHFIHAVIKSIVDGAIKYASLCFRDSETPLIKKIEDIKSYDLKLRYTAFHRAVNKQDHEPDKNVMVANNILFSIADNDKYYEKLLIDYDEELEKVKHDFEYGELRKKYRTSISKKFKNKLNDQEKEQIYKTDEDIRRCLLGKIKEPEMNMR